MSRLKTNQLIKIFFHNGQFETGRMVEHTDLHLIIESEDFETIIINDPFKNILMIKVLEKDDRSSVLTEDLEDELESINLVKKQDLRNRSLGELHKLKAKAERERVKELLQSSKLQEIAEVKFGTPDFTKPIPKCPPKKIR